VALGAIPIAGFRGLNWSLDDRFLIYGTADPKSRRYSLARVAVAGGSPERIAAGLSDRRLMDARLHPDGRRLLFESGEDNDEIWVMEHLLPLAPSRAPGRARRW
jgi:Tol biopolymer transport system component